MAQLFQKIQIVHQPILFVVLLTNLPYPRIIFRCRLPLILRCANRKVSLLSLTPLWYSLSRPCSIEVEMRSGREGIEGQTDGWAVAHFKRMGWHIHNQPCQPRLHEQWFRTLDHRPYLLQLSMLSFASQVNRPCPICSKVHRVNGPGARRAVRINGSEPSCPWSAYLDPMVNPRRVVGTVHSPNSRESCSDKISCRSIKTAPPAYLSHGVFLAC